MFEAILMCTDPVRGRTVQAAIVATGQVAINRVLESPPTTYEIIRLLNVTQPDLFIVDLDDGQAAADAVRNVRQRSRSTVVVAFGDGAEDGPDSAAALGVEAVVPYPVDVPSMLAAIDRAIHDKRGDAIDNLYTFLPAKAGCGTSTLVLHTAVRLANDLGRKSLVFEADLRSGVLDVMIGAGDHGGSQRILEIAGQVDSFQWENNIHRALGVEFMLTRRESAGAIPDWHSYHQVLGFARPRYQAILVDLPELVNPATVEIIRRAASTFVVCTPELAPLRLAKLRCEEIAMWGAPRSRIHILLNRWQKGEMSAGEVEKFTGFPVAAVLPNDYRSLREAMNEASVVTVKTPFGQAVRDFAGQLAGEEPVPQGGLLKKWFG